MMCVRVCSAHRQVLPYSSRSKARLLTATYVRAAFFHSIQYSRSRTRSSCRIRKEWPSQTFWLLLMTHMTALSSPTRLNTSSLQTLSDQEMLETFLQSHRHLTALRLQRRRFDSIQKSTPDDSLYNSLLLSFRQRLPWRLLSAALFSF